MSIHSCLVGSLSGSVALGSSGLSVLTDETLEVELLDHLVDNRISELDVAQLDGRSLGDEIHLSFSLLLNSEKTHESAFKKNTEYKDTYLFLELERDASDGALLNSLHEMRGVTYSSFKSQ